VRRIAHNADCGGCYRGRISSTFIMTGTLLSIEHIKYLVKNIESCPTMIKATKFNAKIGKNGANVN